ncbi:MAG: YkgJ family cysteine cluster protein [Desulfopila sp.]|jgi:Fe-S-cluster containining protein|nr:YkgJ family cysteine cluster protein [Desulfopila sp.]
MKTPFESSALNTLFTPCRQCGNCCKQYRKITLQEDEVAFIKKMGGEVGIDISLKEIREKGIEKAREDAGRDGKVFMIHPDNKGCVFLQRKNDLYYCKIYHYRPRACQGFRCNLADNSMMSLISGDAYLLLGQNSYGLPLEAK